jgi:hypothetical protein
MTATQSMQRKPIQRANRRTSARAAATTRNCHKTAIVAPTFHTDTKYYTAAKSRLSNSTRSTKRARLTHHSVAETTDHARHVSERAWLPPSATATAAMPPANPPAPTSPRSMMMMTPTRRMRRSPLSFHNRARRSPVQLRRRCDRHRFSGFNDAYADGSHSRQRHCAFCQTEKSTTGMQTHYLSPLLSMLAPAWIESHTVATPVRAKADRCQQNPMPHPLMVLYPNRSHSPAGIPKTPETSINHPFCRQ